VAEFDDADGFEFPPMGVWGGRGGGGGGVGGLGSRRLSERVTTVTPTTGLDLDSMSLQMRPSTAGNCLGLVHVKHPPNLPLSTAQEGTGSGGVAGVELDEEATPGTADEEVTSGTAPLGHCSAENRGPTMLPFLMGLLPISFLHWEFRITLEH